MPRLLLLKDIELASLSNIVVTWFAIGLTVHEDALRIIDPLWKATPSQYSEVIMGSMASRISSLIIVYSTVHSGADQRKHQSSVSLAGDRWIPSKNGQ